MILTVDQAAALLHFEAATVRRLAARGEIPARKVGGMWRFSAEQLEQFIREGDQCRSTSREALHGTGVDSASAVAKFASLRAQASEAKLKNTKNSFAVVSGGKSS